MTAGTAALVIGVVVLVVVTAVLSVLETVLHRFDLVRALAMEDDEQGADDLVWLLEHRGTALNVTLTLTVAVWIAMAAFATVLAGRWWSGAAGIAVAILVMTLVTLVLAEIAPRTVTMRHLERTGQRVAPLARALVTVVAPLANLLVRAGQALAGERRGTPSGPFPTDEPAVETLSNELGGDEEIEDEERAMIRSIFELGDTIAREIMVPRPDMVTVDENAPLRDLVNTIIEYGYSRIPVFRQDREQIIGVVYAKDVLRRVALQPDRGDWKDLLREATFIPETKRVDDLLRELQDQSVHIAFVVDEYGATAGLVTIEDILEEIVGEIVDEHDHEAPLVEILEDERMRIDARLPVDDLNELLDVDLPDDSWDTVGGLVVGALGHVPTAGESVDLHGVHFVTERVQGRRVAKVVVSRVVQPEKQEQS